MKKIPLPIDPILPELCRKLEEGNALVLEAAPGSGKTTRVPPALLDAAFRGDREILVLEPRRLAAKMAARRVAEELGEDIGATVGYQFRFENVGSAGTRIRFLTEGMFLRRLISDQFLKNVAAVIVDEFHERHLQGDVALAALRRLQCGERKDLRVVVMSATLDGEAVAAYLGNAPRLKVDGRLYDVTVEYVSDESRRLADQVANAVASVVAQHSGDILVFLPGQAEIRWAGEALHVLARRENLLVVPLFGDLSKEEQERAVRPADRRKVILSTNVAETSLTIEGVSIVIDSGLARQASFSHWAGLPALRTRPISKASAIQRAGRAGRTGPGRCVRLYGKHSFESRAPFETPEILRADISQTVLELKTLGVTDISAFPWFESPPQGALESSMKLLRRLEGLSEDGTLTALGRRMAEMPTHPRLARLILEGERLGAAEDTCRLAALLSEGRPGDGGQIDLLTQFERNQPDPLARRSADQLAKYVQKKNSVSDKTARENALRRAVLAAFPDRVAKKRANELVLGSGGSVAFENAYVFGSHEYFVAVDIEERSYQPGRPTQRILRSVCSIEPEWLFDKGVVEKTETKWDAERERVQAFTLLLYDGLVLDESQADAGDLAIAECLADAALSSGLSRFCDEAALQNFIARVRFLRDTLPDASLPDFAETAIKEALVRLCQGRRSFAELREADIVAELALGLTPEQRQKLEKLAPEQTQLAAGRRVRVHYEQGKAPWVESRLQDFFGMRTGPSVLGGRVPLTLHLLAPNHRAVQVTSDLAGFWTRVYPDLRRELGRRYPRHKWPEEPA